MVVDKKHLQLSGSIYHYLLPFTTFPSPNTTILYTHHIALSDLLSTQIKY